MFARYVIAIASGTFITLCLLFVMHALIDMQPSALTATRPSTPIGWATVREPEPLQLINELEFDREELTKTVQPPLRSRATGENTGVPYSMPLAAKPAGRYSMPDFVPTDGPLVAIVRVLPEYPMRANGREGYVIVRFDVLETGRVNNAVIIESSDHVFDKAALKAAERSRFRARVVDGVPLASSGVQMIYRFEMEDKQMEDR